jgi:Protein O-mannosyl-transferase TMEM260-like
LKFLKKYFAVLTGLFVFIIYLTTLAPSVVEIDSGELTAVQATLGIAHPTGYPLFTIIGHLFSLIPMPFPKVYQLNLLAAIWCSLGVGIFVYTAKLVLDNLDEFKISRETKKLKHNRTKQTKKLNKSNKKSEGQKGKIIVKQTVEVPELKRYLAPILAGLMLAFSKTYWFQSTSVEVYSMQIFLFSLIILFLIKAFLSESNISKSGLKNPWIVFAVFLALGFTNHMTTLLIIPATAYFYFVKNGFNKESYKKIGLMLLVFFPILIIIYSYLPVRASMKPAINWGDPVNLENIYRQISGKQYQVWLFSSTAAAKKQFVYFINNLPNEFSISLFIIAIGIYYSFKVARRFFSFLVIVFLFTVLYSINYDIHDIDSYFLLAYISLAFFATFGIVKIFTIIKFHKYTYLLSTSLIALFIIVQAYFNYEDVNQSDTYTFKDYAQTVLTSVPENSIIFSYQWDYLVSPSYYFQYVENMRRDVAVVDKELLRRSWYYNQIETDHPYVLDSLHVVVKEFLNALKPFERGEQYNSNLLESLYRKIMTGLIAANIDKRNYYIGPELVDFEMQRGQFQLPQGCTLVPELLLFKVINGNKYVPAPDPDFKIRFPANGNHYVEFIKNLVGRMLERRAIYEMQFDKVDRARLYINKLKKEFPGFAISNELLNAIEK